MLAPRPTYDAPAERDADETFEQHRDAERGGGALPRGRNGRPLAERRDLFTCEECGEQFEGSTHGNAKNRHCSERCRRAQYGGTCLDCGESTYGGAGRDAAPTRCDRCHKARNAERNERIYAAWNEGEPGWYIAEREGMTETDVLNLIDRARRRYGRDLALHRKRNRTDWPEIERLYREGKRIGEIAEALGENYDNVARMVIAMREAGYDLPPRSRRYSEEDIAEIEGWWAGGLTCREIGERLGITAGGASSLIVLLRDRGYDLPPRRAVAA